MTDYEKYPKPKADMTKGESAKDVSTVKGAGQHHISGTMGKHQRTGTGKEGGGNKGSY